MVPQNKTEKDLVGLLINKSDECSVARIGLIKLDEKIVDLDGNQAHYTSWGKNEPNGRELEPCVSINSNSKYNDEACFSKKCYACEMPTNNIYFLRGDMPDGIDRQYFVRMTGKRTEIRGFKQTECIWNKTWQFGPDLKQEKPLKSSDIPPVGVHNWNNGQKLKFSLCHRDKFTCHTYGDCIPMKERCNGQQDCSDGSDEANCTIMTLQDGYDKKYPAKKNTPVSISMEIYDILNVNELEMQKNNQVI